MFVMKSDNSCQILQEFHIISPSSTFHNLRVRDELLIYHKAKYTVKYMVQTAHKLPRSRNFIDKRSLSSTTTLDFFTCINAGSVSNNHLDRATKVEILYYVGNSVCDSFCFFILQFNMAASLISRSGFFKTTA